MGVGWCGTVISILLILPSPEPVAAKKKIIKLIVPHKIKYLHHTHVLLVTPKKKASHKAKDEIVEDEPNYHYIHEGRPKGKPQVHYVLPYIAQSKEGYKKYNSYRPSHNDEELDTYQIDDYHKRFPEESDVVVKVLPPGKGVTVPRGFRVPYEAESSMTSMKVLNKPRYVLKEPPMRNPHYSYENSPPEEIFTPPVAYHTLPADYDADYMPPLAEMDPNALAPEEGGWGSQQFSVPEKLTSTRSYYKGGYYEPESHYNR